MSKTVLSNPGSVGVSFTGVTDQFQVVANICMIGKRLMGFEITDEMIMDSLEDENLEPTAENIEKVKAFM